MSSQVELIAVSMSDEELDQEIVTATFAVSALVKIETGFAELVKLYADGSLQRGELDPEHASALAAYGREAQKHRAARLSLERIIATLKGVAVERLKAKAGR